MIYQVVVDISTSSVDKVFDYYYDEKIAIGARVRVPFGNQKVEGFVIDNVEHTLVAEGKLKPLYCVLDNFTALSDEMIALCKYMSKRYNLRLIDALRLAVPSQMRNDSVKPLIKNYASLMEIDKVDDLLATIKKNATAQRQIIEYLCDNKECLVEELNNMFGWSALKTLIKKNIVSTRQVTQLRTPYSCIDEQEYIKKSLTVDQIQVVDKINNSKVGNFLLHGVTGSGKTEVYMTLIEQTIYNGNTAMMLVPEISLTPNVLKLFRSRFGDNVAILHSGLSQGERYDEWLRLMNGQAKIVLGARSAVFAPLKKLGIIIIDEEHDSSYQSESNPRYNTIDVAKFRANFNKCNLIMGSATPSVESYFDCSIGKATLLQLNNRINNMPLPKVEIVDMTLEVASGNKGLFSNRLLDELKEVIESGNQAMLFLNRRGFSSFVMCTKCGNVAKCVDCDASLVYHYEENVLKCHYCGKVYKMLDACPVCKSPSIRQGKIGTEQVVKLLASYFPDVKVLRMDYDTTRNKDELVSILNKFSNKKAQILVGTQMIAKGHDFPGVTLVGILDADQSLFQTDYRSAERTFQLLTQVAGRSGRQELIGRVVLQTYNPTHYVLQLAAKQDYISFYKREINIREATNFPPFATLIRLLYASVDNELCIKQLNAHYEKLVLIMKEYGDDFIFMNKMRSPIKRLESKFRYQILIRLNNNDNTDIILQKIYGAIEEKIYKETMVFAELNPQNLN